MGISPSGAIIFISQLYDGSISDKEIVVRSGILDPVSGRRGFMYSTKGFTTADDLKTLNVELNIPAFLSGRYQLTKAEVKGSHSFNCICLYMWNVLYEE